jgi:SAM-dependent methyltransferase
MRIETFRRWLPRLSREKGFETVRQSCEIDDDLIEHAVSWWKEDRYTKVKRFICLKWLGRTLLKIPYTESIESNYNKPANDIVHIIIEMQNKGLITEIDESSHIFEGGCNIGRNLLYLQKAFNCIVEGMDISEKAISIANHKIWKRRQNYKFHVGNVLTTDFFNNIEDNAFDLAFTRWHLVHLPKTSAKTEYVDHLKRIAKALILFEPVKKGKEGTDLYHDKSYALSWDDWAKDYDLTEYEPKIKLPNHTRVFYYAENSPA